MISHHGTRMETMVKLTEEMIVARTRVSDFSAVKKLNCWGSELSDVSILRKMENVEVLSLSVNNIDTLADFQYCHNLQDLFVRKNNIKDLNEVCYLQELPNLKNLWLGENPCAEKEGYRLAVLRALPNLEKLDDKVVSSEEVQTALARGRVLVHPLDMDASPPQSAMISPERSYEEIHHTQEEYHDPDRRNANCKTSLSHHYAQSNQYSYEDNDDQPAVSRHNGDYDERRTYSEYVNNDVSQRPYTSPSPRTQYAVKYESQDDTRFDRNNYEYDDKRQIECDESLPQPSAQHRRMAIHHTTEREDTGQVPGWVRHSDKEKCRAQFHYHRRPVTRNSNILSAVLCLVKELDYPSLEVVEMAGTVAFSRVGSISSIPSPEFSDSLDSIMTSNQCIDNDTNFNFEHRVCNHHCIDENSEKPQIHRNGSIENCNLNRNSKNVPADSNLRQIRNNSHTYKHRDSGSDKLTPTSNSEQRKSNDVRRVASSDSIPRGNHSGVYLNQGCKDLNQDCIRRSKSPDVRNTVMPLRYIQSSKGTWTYNLDRSNNY
ncbi:hypothetical protein KPH14_010265 [Odynerus spinipes]|uniref:Protein tilB homolog n=1 Tax=Odynerus spinipes TaxID=1348599 RepID=A0AAD9RTY0_9HYME|nr:hypothetical protein KPH14_010265 [Odynerus spinipes]